MLANGHARGALQRLWIVGLLVGALLAGGSLAVACSVPVFRYALERWAADEYLALVFYRGKLDEDSEKAITALESSTRRRAGFANLEVQRVDLDSDVDPALQAIWDRQADTTLPRLVLTYPPAARIPVDIWSGSPMEAMSAPLADSPVRKEIGERLLNGETAVWVLLDSGNAERDNEVAELLKRELERLHEMLELPELAAEDEALVAEGPELRVLFSTLRLSRNDPAEQVTVKMLLNTEPDLVEFDEPMVFPVFGQGRAYFALVGGGIDRDNIEEIGRFLVGECSCEVKEQNPGTDLLLNVDWQRLHGQFVRDEELPPLVGVPESLSMVAANEGATPPSDSDSGSSASEGEVTVQHTAAAEPLAEVSGTGSSWIWSLVWMLAGAVAVVAGASVWMMRQQTARAS